MSDDLIAFLAARVVEDEWEAKAVRDAASKRTHYRESLMARADRDLREVAVKRAILAEHAPDMRERGWCCRCRVIRDDNVWIGRAYPCPTLRQLAAVYSGHPDYQEKWKP